MRLLQAYVICKQRCWSQNCISEFGSRCHLQSQRWSSHRRKTRDVEYGPENQEFLVWWTGVFICWFQRASKKFNISRSREFIGTICHSFLCPMLELRISGACKVALPEASSAVTPFVPKVLLQCGAYLFWGSSGNFLAENCSLNM